MYLRHRNTNNLARPPISVGPARIALADQALIVSACTGNGVRLRILHHAFDLAFGQPRRCLDRDLGSLPLVLSIW
jgi:hypothetical protein